MNAQQLYTLQRCARQYALEREWKVLRRRPREVLETLMRQAVIAITNGQDVAKVSDEACTRLLETAARPGLDISTDPYTIARDYCAIIQNSLEALSRLTLLSVKPAGIRTVNAIDWQLSCLVDESGLLHRWICVPKWEEDTRFREIHSWAVFGDCCAAQVGMTLHVIEIGEQRKGHQHTPWAKAYRHPVIPNKFRFRKVDGSRLERSWTPVWYQNSDKNDPKTWVDLMEHDGLELIHHLAIKEPAKEHVEQFARELLDEAERGADNYRAWNSIPMYRPACDLPYVCPWQLICFAPPGPVDIGQIGAYIPR